MLFKESFHGRVFHVSSGGIVFQIVGASFLSGGVGGAPWEASLLVGGGSKKFVRWRGALRPPCFLSTMRNPEKNHLIIKNNCSILKKQ